jgi:hypothetical protein
MKTLEYYSAKGKHTVFDGYTIDEHSVVRNASGHVMAPFKSGDYYRVCVRHEEKSCKIHVCRAMASTFIGPPPTLQHTADHKDKNSLNDVLSNIRWLCKSGQVKNRDMPPDNKSAFIIVRNDVELTAKDWATNCS